MLAQVRDGFFDAVPRRKGKATLEIEFPFASKSLLDEIRSRVVPTLPLHHRLKIVDSDKVDEAEEKTLCRHPEGRMSLGRSMERKLIWSRFNVAREMAIEHVKPEGRVLNLSEGEIVKTDFKTKTMVLRRFRFKGRGSYDGLGIPKEQGDYAISEVREGDWHYRHTYFRAGGEIIGTYYNINTPVELYPDRIRYVDLEVDVVCFPDGTTRIVDEGELAKRFEEGTLSAEMRDKALGEARRLSAVLQSVL